MSLRVTENQYMTARDLNKSISEKFNQLENKQEADKSFLAESILADADKLARIVSRINVNDFLSSYCKEDLAKLKQNIELFKETAFYMKRTVNSMLAFDKVRPAISGYMKHVDWYVLGRTDKEAAETLSRFLTSEDNYEQYKSINSSIAKGTMRTRAFHNLFETLKFRIPKKSKLTLVDL